MDSKCNKVRLYTVQTPIVVQTIEEKGVTYVKREFIKKKYKECSDIFLQSYDWFINKARDIIDKPKEAEYAIWAFTEAKYAGVYNNVYLIALDVPIDEVIFFKIEEWNRILNLRYLPKDDNDKVKYYKKLESYNITDETDIFMKPFYPHLKIEVKKSWDNLFKYDKVIKKHGLPEEPFQASLWQIKKEWVVDLKKY